DHDAGDERLLFGGGERTGGEIDETSGAAGGNRRKRGADTLVIERGGPFEGAVGHDEQPEAALGVGRDREGVRVLADERDVGGRQFGVATVGDVARHGGGGT